jgi:putative ABC transport system permease protein
MTRPPTLPERMLTRVLTREQIGLSILGDLAEEHHRVCAARGPRAAAWFYWRAALALIAHYTWRRALTWLPRHRRGLVGPPKQKGASVMDGIWRDLRQGLRALLREPGFAAIVACTIGVGLAANATILAVVDGLILRPFPLPSIDRLVQVFAVQPQGGLFADRQNLSPADFVDFQRESNQGQNLVALQFWEANITATTMPERIQAFRVSPGFFRLLEVEPMLGRSFVEAEGQPGQHLVAVLGYALWMGRFGGDRDILGRTIELDGERYQIVGVAPPKFDYPFGSQVWTPLAFTPDALRPRAARYLRVIGHLADGRRVNEVEAELNAINSRIAEMSPDTHRGWSVKVLPLTVAVRDMGVGVFIALWQASAVLILLIACANVANLMLVRGAARERALALTVALGASRWRVIRQQLIEGIVLALAGALLAVPLAWIALRALTVSLPPRIARFVKGWDQIDLDARGLVLTALLAIASAVIYGIVPAWRASRVAVVDALKEGGRGSSGGRHRFRQGLVVAEIALALTLLVAAGLSIEGVLRLITRDDGYDPAHVMTMRVTLPAARYQDTARRREFFERLVEHAAARPDVEHAAVTSILPSTVENFERALDVDGRPVPDESRRPRADYRVVTPDYFAAMKIPFNKGRGFGTGDRPDTMPVTIVSKSMAARLWPNEDPIGKRFRPAQTEPWLTIVGVAGDVRQDWFFDQHGVGNMFYVPLTQAPLWGGTLVLRGRGEPGPLGAVGSALVRELDPDQPVTLVQTMSEVRSDRALAFRMLAGVMGVFSGIGLLLAAVGVYGVMAYNVNQRTHEIGIRVALGAARSDIVRTTVGRGLRLTLFGLGFGLIGAYALARAMESFMFGTITITASSFIAVTLMLAAVAIVATLAPTRRALRVDPVVALRTQ